MLGYLPTLPRLPGSHDRVLLFILLATLSRSPLTAQDRAVTLPEALALAARAQPGIVQAEAEVRTSAAQRRSAWGSFLPSLTASSSASDFFAAKFGFRVVDRSTIAKQVASHETFMRPGSSQLVAMRLDL